MGTIFYKKIKNGKRNKYIPVQEYDPEFLDALPYDCVMLEVHREYSMSRRYNIDPAMAPMVAASIILEDKLTTIISDASKYKEPGNNSVPLTVEQRAAWDKLNESFGGAMTTLYGPAVRDVAESILKALAEEAQKLLTNESTKAAYEQFIMLSKLSK